VDLGLCSRKQRPGSLSFAADSGLLPQICGNPEITTDQFSAGPLVLQNTAADIPEILYSSPYTC